jgi:hypothetical protein
MLHTVPVHTWLAKSIDIQHVPTLAMVWVWIQPKRLGE